MYPQYKVITAHSAFDLSEQVNNAIEGGYYPIGSATCTLITTHDPRTGHTSILYTQTVMRKLDDS